MKNFCYGLVLSLQFLTRLPVPVEAPWNAFTSRWAARVYPLTGIIIGLLPALTVWMEFPVPPAAHAFMIVTFFVWISGGLHLDGWMDTFDAVGANVSLEKKWEIMKDPHVGSFGILSVIFLLGWKTFIIYELLVLGVSPWIFVIVPALGRFTAVFLLAAVRSAKPHGLARSWQQHISKKDLITAFLPVLIILIWTVDPMLTGVTVSMGIFLFFCRLWIIRNFHGVSGDLAGASIEGGELWGLITAWIFISFVTV